MSDDLGAPEPRRKIQKPCIGIGSIRMAKEKTFTINGKKESHDERVYEPTDEYRYLLSPETRARLGS